MFDYCMFNDRAGLDTVPANLNPLITGLTLEGNEIAYVGNMEMYKM